MMRCKTAFIDFSPIYHTFACESFLHIKGASNQANRIQIKHLELYGWFYENGYQEIMQKMNSVDHSISIQGQVIPVNKQWPWFHSLIGDAPIDWNRTAQPSGGHFDFFDYGQSMYHFHEGSEKSNLLFVAKEVLLAGLRTVTLQI